MEHRTDVRIFVMAFVATSLALIGLLEFDVVERVSYAMERGRLRALRESLPTQDRLDELGQSARTVAELVTPAVVSIEADLTVTRTATEHHKTSDERRSNAPKDDRNTGTGAGDSPAGGSEQTTSGVSAGSGFVFDAEHGRILTNAHVVGGAKRVHVYLADGRTTEGKILGLDPERDLAVIAIDLPRLHALPFGDSDKVRAGDDVFAVGNPFGLEGSVSKGIISAVSRRNVRIGSSLYESLLQTDAVITPGSSGGPLVNLRGEVIGINTAMATDAGEYDGVGFAIPAANAVAPLADLIEGGPAVLGVMVGSISDPHWDAKRRALGWNESFGALITEVVPGGPADRAGLRPDDIVLTLSGRRIESHDQLASQIAAAAPGTEVTLGIWRDGRHQTLSVTVGRKYAPR